MFEFLNVFNPWSDDFSYLYMAALIVLIIVVMMYFGLLGESFQTDRKYGILDLGISQKDVKSGKLDQLNQLDGK